jgi:hypothetical protein
MSRSRLSPMKSGLVFALLALAIPAGAAAATAIVNDAEGGRSRLTSSAAAEQCVPTRANGRHPGVTDPGVGTNHGNRWLWVGIPRDGRVVVSRGWANVQADGTIAMKLPWWRGRSGRLTISGRRLDASDVPLAADVPSGYGIRGFQSSGVVFSSEGCWSIAGEVRRRGRVVASLSVVLLVLR